MKKIWITVLLTASVALNLAFISTLAYKNFFAGKDKPGHKPGVAADINTRLELQPEQKAGIDEIFKKFRFNLMKFKQDILEKRMDLIDELGDPDFDTETIAAKTKELNALENSLNLTFVDSLVQVNHILDARQRLKFLYKVSQNWFFLDKGRRRRK
ncbi:MAG: periplasmic heavy metal sensor [Candidatus Aminicenantes bacterium]|nr:periplasmic heavy metal sensor [Candidatus Aminicenantes bacterium]